MIGVMPTAPCGLRRQRNDSPVKAPRKDAAARPGLSLLGHVLIRYLRNILFILRSGVFAHSDYAHAYLKSRKRFYLSLLHYALLGEKRGNLPNPFFDPDYFKDQSGSRRLADYLCDEKFSGYSPSRYFDTQWYAAQNPDWRAIAPHPFVHFWAKGFDKGRNPSEALDMNFFKQAVMRDRRDKKAFCFELLADKRTDLPLNAAQLKERRERFYKRVELDVLRQAERARSPFLVFVQAGRSSGAPPIEWPRNFDLLINYYELPDCVSPGADYVFRQIGTKVTAIRKILETRPDILLRYEAILFLDDDIHISPSDIDRLFGTVTAVGLDLAQASLSPNSCCHFEILKQPGAGRGLTPLTAVEIMMPVISSRALREFGWVFDEGISGWGVDLLLSAKVREKFGNTIALVGEAVGRHEHQVDTLNGRYYKFLKAHGIDATIEAGDIATKFKIDDTKKMISVHPEPLRGGVARARLFTGATGPVG